MLNAFQRKVITAQNMVIYDNCIMKLYDSKVNIEKKVDIYLAPCQNCTKDRRTACFKIRSARLNHKPETQQ